MRRVVLLGLRGRGEPGRFAGQVSNPSSPRYRQFLTPAGFRDRFSANKTDRRRVRRYLARQRGVGKVELSSGRTVVLAVMTPNAGRRIFCARGAPPPTGGLCRPKRLRGVVRQVSVGEVYERGGQSSRTASEKAGTNTGTPGGCQDAIKTGAFTPNQLATAYEVDPLQANGLDGSGVRVATLSSQEVDTSSFATWAKCFGLPAPKVRQIAMPSAGTDTGTAPEETVLDVEALASLAPGLDRITPIYVPLDQSFSHSFALFMFGALDPSRQGGELPDILSISDGVCENRFTTAQLRLGQRMLAEAAALGITALAASGDLGFRGCFTSARGASFPNSSRFVTGVGGTDLTLTAANGIAEQVVWSTYATQPQQGVGSGGGPSDFWNRPGFQTGPGIGPAIQSGKPTRLGPDLAAMASFTPGLATYQGDGGGWGIGGGTSAATPLTAAMISLVLQQEEIAGRPGLGSIPPLLYQLARSPAYHSVISDITVGTGSRKPKSAVGMTPAGGAAQPGFDLATGLGSLRAAPFSDFVAALPPSAP